ncbi:MAG: TIGR04279 domain-containing protein [ANME-2 cluster archaeon]|nr:TIGR04279 domain-containing protein [ANME-2 cluster archaeon]MBC2701129.1 TIGR04279 domain-containing protein [ANME-2 cluster archaeon]MBC2747373.1 TIGR04279 domain-containing protein [ANME-2 cluster archaeon]
MSKQYVILFIVFMFLLVPDAAGSAMDSPYLLNISINSTEDLSFANHNESPIEGNWIKLNGGTPVTLPALNLIFNSVNSSNYTLNGKAINITTSVDNYSDYLIEYPYSSHSIYTNVSDSDEVNLSFFGSSHFADLSIDIYLVNSTIDEVWDIFNDVIDGNTTLIRNLLNDSEERLNYSLNGTGDSSSISFGSQQAGDYIILVLLNSSHTNPNEYSILSATAVQILKYESVVTAPASAKTNNIVPVQIELTGANQNYTYGAILIHKDAYEATLRFEFNGTGKQTNLTIDGADLIEMGELTGINLSSLNTTKLQEIIETVIGPENGTVAFTDNTDSISASFSLTTNDLNTGDYYLLVGAYESGERLVAFDQSIINIYTPSDSSNGGGGGGGGGGTSGEAFENIICTETDRQFVGKDLNVKYNFILECNCVQHIEFTGLTSAGKVAAKVEMLNHTSTTVDKDAPNIVFKNLNVWIGNMGYFSKNNVKDPTITFIVDRSWVSDNDIILNTISFYYHNDYTNTWEKMPTQKIGEDSTSYQFKASLPIRGSLGPMAISGKNLVYVPTSVPTSTPMITPSENILEIISNATNITTWTEIWKTKVPGFQALTAIIALITLYIIRNRRD